MKIDYRLAGSRHTSTAYLDDDAPTDSPQVGQDKYTDADVLVQWDAERGCWQELKPTQPQPER